MTSATALYRFYDEDNRLLYVGITDDLDTRWAAHANNKHWWPNVARKAVEWHEFREDAAKGERDAILTENPLYNVAHSPASRRRPVKVKIQRPHGPAPAARWHAKVLEELGRQGKTLTWLAKTSGVSRAGISNWKTQPRRPQAAGVLAVAKTLGIVSDDALRLAGIVADNAPPVDVADLAGLPTNALVREIARLTDELARRAGD